MERQEPRQGDLKALVSGLLGDIQILIRQEVTLAQHEVQHEIAKFLRAVAWFATAAVLALTGFFSIAAAGTLMLFEYTDLPAWACAAIVSILLLGGAAGLMAAGQGIVRTIHMFPIRTIRTLKDDVKGLVNWWRVKRIWPSSVR